MRVRREIGVQLGAVVGDTRVAEEKELHVVVLRQLVQHEVEIPADAGERLVERADVDADAQRALAMRRPPPRAADAIRGGMA
jgi:hypothetical protein